MEAVKQCWAGFTTGARLVVAFMIFMVLIFVIGATGMLETRPTDKAPIASERDQAFYSAKETCEAAVLLAANNKSSVKFLAPLSGPRVKQGGDGKLIVNTRFSAKNAFGSESISTARCVLSDGGKTLIEFAAQDSR